MAAYLEIENGVSMSRDQRALLQALIACLDPTSDELEALIERWVLALLSQELGEDIASDLLRH
jgi:hypothetical protein